MHGGGLKLMSATSPNVKKESVKLQWSGDVDLNDGSLQEQYNKLIQKMLSNG